MGLGFASQGAEMWRSNHIVELQQRAAGRRLLFKNIERRSGYFLLNKSLVESSLVNNAPPGAVDQHGFRLHQGKLLRPYKMACRRHEGNVERDEISLPQQLGQLHQLHPDLGGMLRRDMGVTGQHIHAQGTGPAAHFASNVTQPDNAQCLPVQLNSQEALPGPAALFDRVVCPGDIPGQRHEQGQGELRRRDGVGFGNVDHDNPLFGGLGHINIVHSHAGPPDSL